MIKRQMYGRAAGFPLQRKRVPHRVTSTTELAQEPYFVMITVPMHPLPGDISSMPDRAALPR
jgi:hypothetical protein